jgi:transposase-like protein
MRLQMGKEYSEEFKRESVDLFPAGEVSRAQVARELGVNQHTFYNWVEKQGDKREKSNTDDDLTSENKRLRRELKRVELEHSWVPPAPPKLLQLTQDSRRQ